MYQLVINQFDKSNILAVYNSDRAGIGGECKIY